MSAVDSQRQFPCEGDDEDGGRVPSDDSNLTASSSSSWMPHHQETAPDTTLLTEESEEDADFDLLDETRLQRSDFMEVSQDGIPAPCSVPHPSSCPQRNQDQSPFMSTLPVNPSSTLPSSSASSQLLPSSSAQVKTQARPSASNRLTSQPSPSLPPGSSSHVQTCEDIPYHGNMTADGMDASSGRPDAGPAHGGDEQKMDKVQDDDVQMMQESLSGELGNDWFETLMDHDDWMSNEI